MSRRRPRTTEQADKMAGVLATWSGTCGRCGGEVWHTQVTQRHGEWIHTGCAPGADDE